MTDVILFLTVDGLTNGAIYALSALGIVLVYTVTRVINVAQGDFAMLGALTLVSLEAGQLPGTLYLIMIGLAVWIGLDTWKYRKRPLLAARSVICGIIAVGIAFAVAWAALTLKMPTAVNVVIAVALVGALGPILHRVAIEPIPNASVIVYIIITLGAHMIAQGMALALWGPEPHAVDAFATGMFSVGPVLVTYQSAIIVTFVIALFAALSCFFGFTLTGKALRASALNRLGAQLCGVRVATAGRLAFFFGAGLGAISGILMAPLVGAHYEMGFLSGLKGFVGATLGGLVNYPPAVFGALVIGLLESFFGYTVSQYRDALVFLMIIPILLVLTVRTARRGQRT